MPQLLSSVPQQPTQAELTSDPRLHRFVIIFDREGSTHSLLAALWQQRIGALTYRKNVKDVWPEGEFSAQEVPIPGGGSTRMKLAMRHTQLSTSKSSMPITEVRRLTPSGHQTAIITTTSARYTRRPRNRTDSAVVRLRQTLQQKLKRRRKLERNSAGPPRGLRG